MSNKYDSSDHIDVLAQLNVLWNLHNETQIKINVLDKKLANIKELQKDEDEIPF